MKNLSFSGIDYTHSIFTKQPELRKPLLHLQEVPRQSPSSRQKDDDLFSPSTQASPYNNSLRDSMVAPKLPELHSHFQAREIKYTKRAETLLFANQEVKRHLNGIDHLQHLSPKRVVGKPQIIEDFRITDGTVGQFQGKISMTIANHIPHNGCLKIKVTPKPVTGVIDESVIQGVMDAKDLKILIDNQALKSINGKTIKPTQINTKKIVPLTKAAVTYEDLYNEINSNHPSLQAKWVKERDYIYMVITKKQGQLLPEHFTIKQATGNGSKIDYSLESPKLEGLSKKSLEQNRVAVHVAVDNTPIQRYSAKDSDGNFLFDMQSKGGLTFRLPPPQVTSLGKYDLYHSAKDAKINIKIGFDANAAKSEIMATVSLINDVTKLNTLYNKYAEQAFENPVNQMQQKQLLEYGFMYDHKGLLTLQDTAALESALNKDIFKVLGFFKPLHNSIQAYGQELLAATTDCIAEINSEKEKVAYEIAAMISPPLSPSMTQVAPTVKTLLNTQDYSAQTDFALESPKRTHHDFSQTDLSFASPNMVRDYFSTADLGLEVIESKHMQDYSTQTDAKYVRHASSQTILETPRKMQDYSSQTSFESPKQTRESSSQTFADSSLDSSLSTMSAKVEEAKLDKYRKELGDIKIRLQKVEGLLPKNEHSFLSPYASPRYDFQDPHYLEKAVESGIHKAQSAKLEYKYRYFKDAYEELRHSPRQDVYYDSDDRALLNTNFTRHSPSARTNSPANDRIYSALKKQHSAPDQTLTPKPREDVSTPVVRPTKKYPTMPATSYTALNEKGYFSRSAPPTVKSGASYTTSNKPDSQLTSIRLRDYGNLTADGKLITYTGLHGRKESVVNTPSLPKTKTIKSQKIGATPSGYYIPSAHGHNTQGYGNSVSKLLAQSSSRSGYNKLDLMQSKVTSLQNKLGELRGYTKNTKYYVS